MAISRSDRLFSYVLTRSNLVLSPGFGKLCMYVCNAATNNSGTNRSTKEKGET